MSELPSCNQEFFKKGTSVFLTHTIPAQEIEKWVKKIAELSGQKVDWHYFAGRANILAIGDLEKVRTVIKQLLPEHDLLFEKEFMRGDFFSIEECRNVIYGIHSFNGFE